MLYVETESTDAAFHFSVEEYFMRHIQPDMPVIMLWQADKCAMLGNYQVADAEVNRNYAQKEGIRIVRRPSGGGTIFTDMGTFLYTVIYAHTEQCTQEAAKKKVAALVVDVLNEIGLAAKVEGRNDILLDGKKISGMAQHIRGSRICTHGSLLYDTDLDMLTDVLNVDEGKIQSKAIRSIRSRVTNIREYMDNACTTQEFGRLLKQKLFEHMKSENRELKEHVPNSQEREEIERIYREKFGNDSWTFGRSPEFSFHNSVRFAEGKVEVFLNIVEGAVASCSIHGDFLGTVPIRGLEELLEKKAFQYQAISDALEGIPLAPYLGGITKEQLLSCMFSQAEGSV